MLVKIKMLVKVKMIVLLNSVKTLISAGQTVKMIVQQMTICGVAVTRMMTHYCGIKIGTPLIFIPYQ